MLTDAPRSAIRADHTRAQVFGFSTGPSRHDLNRTGFAGGFKP